MIRNRISGLALALMLGLSNIYAEEVWYTGEGTQYGGIAGTKSGNCGIWVDESDFYHCALNHEQYDASSACGACIHAYGPIGDIVVKVVDQCPECKMGDIDFSTEAFTTIAKLEDGRVPIRWKYVPCPLANDDANIHIFYDAGISPYYFKAMFYNLYTAIDKVEYENETGEWIEISREDYNYFVNLSGLGVDKSHMGPFSFRLTSKTGEKIVAKDIVAKADTDIDLGVQFTTPYETESTLDAPIGNEMPSDEVTRVEVMDCQGRMVATMGEWNPNLLPQNNTHVLIVKQYGKKNVSVQKWIR